MLADVLYQLALYNRDNLPSTHEFGLKSMHVDQMSSAKITVLIVSLSDIWLKSAQVILSSLPDFHVFDTVKGGLSAYDIIRREKPKLLILDYTLPSDEIFLLLKLLQDVIERPYSIVIASSERHQWLALRAGADSTLLRANASDKLVATVQLARKHFLSHQ